MEHCGAGLMVAVAMLSLVAGMFLLMKTCIKEELCCKLFYKIVAYAVVVISMLLIVGGGTRAVWRFSHHGGWKHEMGMMGGRGMKPEMMQEMMKNCPMMKPEMMREMQEEMDEKAK